MEEQQMVMVCSDCGSRKRIIFEQVILPISFNKVCMTADSECEDCGSIGRTGSFFVNLQFKQNFVNKVQGFCCNHCGNYGFIDIKNIQDHPTTDINSQYFYATCSKCNQKILLINYSSKDVSKLNQIMNDKEEQQKIKSILNNFEDQEYE